jgi:lysophospholipase L1-like esterase
MECGRCLRGDNGSSSSDADTNEVQQDSSCPAELGESPPHAGGACSSSSSSSSVNGEEEEEEDSAGNELESLVVRLPTSEGRMPSTSIDDYDDDDDDIDDDDDSATRSTSPVDNRSGATASRNFRARVIAGCVGVLFIVLVSSTLGLYPLGDAASVSGEAGNDSDMTATAALSCPMSLAAAAVDEDMEALLAQVDAQAPRDRCNDNDRSCSCSNPLQPANFTGRAEWNNGYQANLKLSRDAVAAGRELDVVMLGDSIVEFWQATYKGSPLGRFRSNHKVYQRLFDSVNAPTQGLALGVSGDRCNQLLYRIQNGVIDGLYPKVFWVLIGTNDVMVTSCNADQVVAGNVAIVQELRRQRPNATIVVQALFPVGDSNAVAYPEEYNEINRRLACFAAAAAAAAPVEFVNASQLFLTANNTVNETLLPDTLHPSATGAELWGQVIVRTVLRIVSSSGNSNSN